MDAVTLAAALGGRRAGSAWMARCPAHHDREPSLSIRDADGMVLVRCHAGCEQHQVIAALRERGLWTGNRPRELRHTLGRSIAGCQADQDSSKRSAAALAIWRAAIPAGGPPVETYLAARGLKLPAIPRLRFHAGLKHLSGGVWPAMVALVTRGTDDTPLAIHRTFLARDGSGKAPVEPQKMMLGSCGGGVVRLSEGGEELTVAEGIETALSVQQATGVPAWAALSAGGIRALVLPPLPLAATVTIAADPDPVGMAAAHAAAERWHVEGRRVRIATPPAGSDFNDLLRANA